MNKIILTRQLEPYPYKLILVTDRTLWQCVRKKVSPKDQPYDTESAHGVTHAGNGTFVVGVFNGELSTLLHELAHVMVYVFTEIGAPINQDTSEPFAYLLHTTFMACRNALNDQASRQRQNRPKARRRK